MRKIIAVVLVLACGKVSFAQCGKAVILTSSKTEYLDGANTVQRTVDEKSTIEINKTEIIITPSNVERKMTGIIKADSCNWTKSFKDGKSVIKAEFVKEGEDARNATITIEGKEGKVIFLMEVAEMPDRKIRVLAETFEEKK
ncbi:MAG TPA: hypothetical protein VKA49_16770 [Flavitalea sp.]|nr:hypothetical protein [Flavitalea sp.]